MRILGFLLVLVTLSFGVVSPAHAKAWSWWPSNWQGLDFKPYLGDDGIAQRSIWDDDTWTPEAWIKDAGDAKRIMRDLYAINIIEDQYTDGDDIPVLEVGAQFIQLSGLDQRRVLQFVDHVFEITTSEENGMFFVFYSEENSEPYGVFDKNGFQTY